jgi:hypothetical protein
MIHQYDIKMVVLSKMFVYMIRNNTNDTEFYIGYDATHELKSIITNHRSRYDSPKNTSKLYSKMREIGFDKFEFSIIDICTSVDTDDLKKMTIQYIKDLKPTLNNHDYRFDITGRTSKNPRERSKYYALRYKDFKQRHPNYYEETRGQREYWEFARQLRNIVDE